MPNDGYEASDKCIELIICKKELFRFQILDMVNKKIFSIFFQKWLPNKLTKKIIIYGRSNQTTEGSGS